MDLCSSSSNPACQSDRQKNPGLPSALRRFSPLLLIPLWLLFLILGVCQKSEGAPAVTDFTATGPAFVLADKGTTNLRIVLPAEPSVVDKYAAEGLAKYLQQATGADFPVIAASAYTAESGPAIFLGVSPAVIKEFADDPTKLLAPQEFVSLTREGNLFLFGEGIHGNLHAVSDFLQKSLGWRWYSGFDPPVVPKHPSLTLEPFARKGGFSFAYRLMARYFAEDFYYWLGSNMYWEQPEFGMRLEAMRTKQPQPESYPFKSLLNMLPYVHTSNVYIPPSEPDPNHPFDWLKNKNYFKTNPEFFGLINGERNPGQLDFSSPGLRAEMTKNIIEHIERVRRDGSFVARGRGLTPADDPGGGEKRVIISIDANDNPGPLSQSPEAEALVKAYQSPGGPLLDYVIELGELLEKKYPGVMVKFLAYRRSQTQIPPVLPEGKKFPDNAIAHFAPVEDCFLGDWSHPDLQETFGHFKGWNKLVKNLWNWIYPNPYGSGLTMPFAHVRGLADNLKKMKEHGGDGVFFEHSSDDSVRAAGNFTELQTYLTLKLMEDANTDTDALIVEFTDYQYGPAAPLVRKYLQELEDGRRAVKQFPKDVGINTRNVDEQNFPYLTVENIHRWQGYFDEMEQETKGRGMESMRVRRLRRELDYATLYQWFALAKKYPDVYRDHKVYSERIKAVNQEIVPKGYVQPRPLARNLDDFVVQIEAGGKKAPLPSEFDGIDPVKIQQLVPKGDLQAFPSEFVRDPQAAFGYAGPVHKPDLPFQVGFYQWTNRKAPPGQPVGINGSKLSIPLKDITPGEYRLYKLGPITVTPDSWIWFSAESWGTHLEVGDRVFDIGENNDWDAWVSLKFDGPIYGGKAEKDSVLCDRIILVKK